MSPSPTSISELLLPEPHRHVVQGAALFDSMSVRKTSSTPIEHNGTPARWIGVSEVLEMVDMPGIEVDRPNSPAAEKRVGLPARSYRPEVILYDEPTTDRIRQRAPHQRPDLVAAGATA